MTTLVIPIGFVGRVPLTLADGAGTPLNVTGALVRFTLARTTESPAVWSKTTANGGIEVLDAGTGQAALVVADTDWTDLATTAQLTASAEVEWPGPPLRRERVNWATDPDAEAQYLLPVHVVARLAVEA